MKNLHKTYHQFHWFDIRWFEIPSKPSIDSEHPFWKCGGIELTWSLETKISQFIFWLDQADSVNRSDETISVKLWLMQVEGKSNPVNLELLWSTKSGCMNRKKLFEIIQIRFRSENESDHGFQESKKLLN